MLDGGGYDCLLSAEKSDLCSSNAHNSLDPPVLVSNICKKITVKKYPPTFSSLWGFGLTISSSQQFHAEHKIDVIMMIWLILYWSELLSGW